MKEFFIVTETLGYIAEGFLRPNFETVCTEYIGEQISVYMI